MSTIGQPPSCSIASVLFMDIVSYSLRSIDDQTEVLTILQKIVRESAESLVFLRDPVSPAKPDLHTLFPSRSSGKGLARLDPGREIQIPPSEYFVLDKQKGKEKLWLVWSAAAILELEALKKWVNKQYKGTVRSGHGAWIPGAFEQIWCGEGGHRKGQNQSNQNLERKRRCFRAPG